MGTYLYLKAKERALGAGLDLLGLSVKAVLTDNTLYGKAITAATNAGPIAIATSLAHGFSTNDIVAIFGVLGNLAANSRWRITVTGANTFTLNGSTGSGAYTSGGFVVSLTTAEFLSDIPLGARVAISPALTGKVITNGLFDAIDLTIPSVAGNPCQSVNLFLDSGVVGTSRLVAHIDGAVGLPTILNPGTVNIIWGSDPYTLIFQL